MKDFTQPNLMIEDDRVMDNWPKVEKNDEEVKHICVNRRSCWYNRDVIEESKYMYSRLGSKGRSAVLKKAVQRKLEKADRRMLDSMDFEDIENMYELMNQRWWGGKLKVKELRFAKCAKGVDGLYTPIDKEILVDEGLGKLARVGVLLHEMCHLSVDRKYDYLGVGEKTGRIPWHGKWWKREMSRVGFGGRIDCYSGDGRFGWYRRS